MQLVDTHTHLFGDQFSQDVGEVMHRARTAGIETMLLPNIDSSSVDHIKTMVEKFPETKPMWGLHPCHVFSNWIEEVEKIYALIEAFPPIAIGEIGLDFYWSLDFKTQQIHALRYQLLIAVGAKLPVSLHTREATQQTIDIVKVYANVGLTGVFHCFSGTREEAESIIEMGFALGIGGNITFKNNPVREFIKFLPLENIVLETDAPYLAPVPFRGKRNEPAYLLHVVNELEMLYEINKEAIAEQTTKNARRIFRF